MVSAKRSLLHAGARWLALALSCGVWTGCENQTEARTELLLVADTDVAAPNTIHFEVSGPEGTAKRVETEDGEYKSTDELPQTVALVYTEGELGPFTVTSSIVAGNVTIKRTHIVDFVPGKTLLVPLHLASACTRECPGQTCDEDGRCVPEELENLVTYTRKPERVFSTMDGGSEMPPMDSGTEQDSGSTPVDGSTPVADAGADAGSDAGVQDIRICNGMEVDVLTNKDFCGSCTKKCNGAGRICVAGMCK
ncbi:MAG: hypothetical protein QM778_22060 [Myxococcales bacterium]